MSEPREIICVCYANICRSPMAEAILQQALDLRFGAGTFTVTSAGIQARPGLPADPGSVAALGKRGLDASRHQSSLLTKERAERAWRIYAMEEYQAQWIRSLIGSAGTIHVWGEEIPDPIGGSRRRFEGAAALIERSLPSILDDIAAALAAEGSRA
ncbi:MAG TPA: low molecular weight phosphotyrosine protein phosphatase [Actinomycetota bacterium]|nr:low molecular weight phosphotyrosine protein phosphatase [Actinomycetota bacterium]